jgi:hypothetical protein
VKRTLIAGLIVGAACSAQTGITPSSGPRTRAERTGYLETSHYSDVIAFLDSLRGRPELEFGSIGKTNEGREIPYVIASRPHVATPEQARALNRPIVYIQGNIHAGEVEGKEALLALLRDLTNGRKPNVLDSVVLIAVPIYNADGNEKFNHQEINRGSQNGPEMVGVRTNAQGFDLNRDYIKAEAPETRASLAMFTRWDPDIFVDLHTTDGSYHGYALTYAPPLNPAAPLGVYARDSLMPVLRQRMQSRHNFATFDYGDFIDDDTLSKGWVTFDSRPRFGTNYYGLRDRIAILSEAFSHDPFETRVKSTYAFVQEILSLAAEKNLSARNRRTIVSGVVPIRSEMVAAPDSIGVIAEIMERTGDSTRTQPGVPKGRKRTGKFITVKMPVYDRFRPTLSVRLPVRYIIPGSDTAVVRVLRAHGIQVRAAADVFKGGVNIAPVGSGMTFVVDSIITSPRAFQNHRETRLVGHWKTETRAIPLTSYVVDVSQPLGRLAVYMLEPESDDGLADWNYFDSELKPGSEYPVFKIMGGIRGGTVN